MSHSNVVLLELGAQTNPAAELEPRIHIQTETMQSAKNSAKPLTQQEALARWARPPLRVVNSATEPEEKPRRPALDEKYSDEFVARVKAMLTIATVPGVCRLWKLPHLVVRDWKSGKRRGNVEPDLDWLNSLRDSSAELQRRD